LIHFYKRGIGLDEQDGGDLHVEPEGGGGEGQSGSCS